MSFAGGGDNSVTVNINGTSVGLVDALNMANEQLQNTARIFDATGSAARTGGAIISDSTKAWIASLQEAADQMAMTGDRMKLLTDMAKLMGASTAESADAWLAAASSAADYGARLDYLAAQVKMVAAANEQMAASMGAGAGAGGFGTFMGGAMASLGMEGGMAGLFGGLGDAIEGAAGKMMGFIQQAGSMVAGLISFSVLNDVIQEVQGFTDALIQLNIQTEKNQFAWQYLYGGGNNPRGAGIAQGMADWTKKFSMQIPYTRQDLLNAITNLAPMGLSAQGLEHFMPTIADLAATRDPNANLAQVAQVIMSASMGYTRMLKYDLKINPAELIQYGLKATGTGTGIHITDPETLLPALQNYAKAHHLTGAAQDVAHSTFWGQWSSFIDRIQNFELSTGDKLFGGLKKTLNDLSSWIDTHQDQISRFSDLIANGLGGAFKTAADWVGQLMTGIGDSGLFGWLNPSHTPTLTANAHTQQGMGYGAPPKGHAAKGSGPAHEGAPLAHHRNAVVHSNTPPVEEKAPTQLSGWQQAGQVIGDALKQIGEGWDKAKAAFEPVIKQEVKDVGDAFQHLKDSFSPEEKETLKAIGQALLAVPWAALSGALWLLARGLDLMSVVGPKVLDFLRYGAELWGKNFALLQGFLNWLKYLKKQVEEWAGGLKDQATTWGSDLISNFIAGMNSMLPNLGTALGGVAGTIAHWLHHSKPDTGPLANDDTWMPDMMRMFAAQIRDGTGEVAAAMAGVAGALVGAMRPSGGYLPAGGALHGMSGGGPVIVINGSSTLETMKLIDYVLSRRDAHTNSVTRAPGGFGRYQFGTLGGL